MKDYPAKLRLFKDQLEEFNSVYEEASKIVVSKEEDSRGAAQLSKDLLQKEYDRLIEIGKEISALLMHVKNTDEKDKELFSCKEQKKLYRQVLLA